MNADIKYEYDFDPYGDNPKNLIKNESHTITAANGNDFNFIVPRKGLFHRRSLHVVNKATGKELFPGRDFYYGFRFDQIILSGAQQPIYGAIVFNDRRLAAEVIIQYQVLGGAYLTDTQQWKELMANKAIDPRLSRWDAIVDVPDELPPIKHREHSDVFIGMNEVVNSIDCLTLQLKSNFGKIHSMLMEHINDHNNPHRMTLEDLGLDDLGMMQLASQAEAEAGVNNVKYMSSLRVRQNVIAYVTPVMNAHKNDFNNPHKVTKAQVGLGNVPNYPVATTEQAQVGRHNESLMTPLRTKEAMDANVPKIMESHTLNFSNPHKVTKAQVGLELTPNAPIATLPEAIEGIRNDRLMTPYLVKQLAVAGTEQGIAQHLADYNNPHRVTKAQVGLGNVPNYPMASIQETLEGVRNDRFVSPYLLNEYYKGVIVPNVVTIPVYNADMTALKKRITDHENNKNNPHEVDKHDVGLGSVPNWSPYLIGDFDGGIYSDENFITPFGVHQMLTSSFQMIPVVNKISSITNIVPVGYLLKNAKIYTGGRTLNYNRNVASFISGLATPTIVNLSTDDYEPDNLTTNTALLYKVQIDHLVGELGVPIGLGSTGDIAKNYFVSIANNTAKLISYDIIFDDEINMDRYQNYKVLETIAFTAATSYVLEVEHTTNGAVVKVNGTKINFVTNLKDLISSVGLYAKENSTGSISVLSWNHLKLKTIESDTGKIYSFENGKATLLKTSYIDDDIVYTLKRDAYVYSPIDSVTYRLTDQYELIPMGGGGSIGPEDFMDTDEIKVKIDPSTGRIGFELTGKVRKMLDVDGDVQFEV